MNNKNKLILKSLRERILSEDFKESFRLNKQCFIRNRTLNFEKLLIFQLNLQSKSLNVEIERFVKMTNIQNGKYSKQAYSQSRKKLSHKAYIELNSELVEKFYSDGSYKKYKGYRLLAVDGSRITLPKSEEIIKKFGLAENKGVSVPMSMSSVCYDVLNELNINTELSEYKANERDLLNIHIDKIKVQKIQCKDLYIVDRGYPSIYMMAKFAKEKTSYLARVSADYFIKEMRGFSSSSSNDEVITINLEEKSKRVQKELKEFLDLGIKTIQVRIVKIQLSSGITEYLMTNVIDKDELTIEDLNEIYHLRWNEETYFNLQKNLVEIENFSGKTVESIYQDYYAKAFVLNISSLIAADAQEIIDEAVKNKTLKYEKYRVNKSVLLGVLKDTIVDMFFNDNIDFDYDYLVTVASRHKIPVIPNRQFERKKKIKNSAHLFRRKAI